MRNAQRLMALRNPKVGEVKLDNGIDNRIIKKLRDSGFIDNAYNVGQSSLHDKHERRPEQRSDQVLTEQV